MKIKDILTSIIISLPNTLLRLKKSVARLILIFLGFLAALWFIIRVIPKPSRAFYPCQKIAFPFSSAFVIWVIGILTSSQILNKAKAKLATGNKLGYLLLLLCSFMTFTISLFIMDLKDPVYGSININLYSKQGTVLFNQDKSGGIENIVEPKSIVSIVRSEKSEATDITFNEINNLIRQAVTLEGSFDELIHNGDDVVLKPNVVTCREAGAGYDNSFPAEVNGVATDYRVVQVVVNMIREINRDGRIFLLEGSGFGVTRKNMNALGYNSITGIDSIIYLDENIDRWYDPASPTLVRVSLPSGKNLYSQTNEYFLNKIYYEADVIISLPCVKSHFVEGISGGIKNVALGAAPVEMYGSGPEAPEDEITGRWYRIDHGDFHTHSIPLDKWIHDFYLCKPVNYVIMDGLQGVEYGPYPGSSSDHKLHEVQKNLGLVIAGKDPLAVDAVEALIMGFDPYLINHLVYLSNDSAGCINPSFIRVRGIQVHEVKTDFKVDLPGRQYKYSDFIPPQNTSVISWELIYQKLNLNLSSADDLAKIEISYDGQFLDQVIVGNFSSFSVPIYVNNPDYRKIKIHLYDRYLNSSVLILDSSTMIQKHKIESLKIYPNPATSIITISPPDNITTDWFVGVYDFGGRLMIKRKINYLNNWQLDISSLDSGIYTITVTSETQVFQAQIIKID